ncbi:predicted protein [Naegleria gruberi]|uniref:Predicted protein n=1 Tax=Naegleria gruberi TaxID=5762 RepID=D2V336_NAEGR|nr:uncharacterized protein NAEGRDRAFT_63214 [Naegleria gruberi]EFC48563.1 predicted protein [Naegleria gruberi]|eukprot:XP_002681307.1 predicted protein [Naegleria gruberi strain NEG-M]
MVKSDQPTAPTGTRCKTCVCGETGCEHIKQLRKMTGKGKPYIKSFNEKIQRLITLEMKDEFEKFLKGELTKINLDSLKPKTGKEYELGIKVEFYDVIEVKWKKTIQTCDNSNSSIGSSANPLRSPQTGNDILNFFEEANEDNMSDSSVNLDEMNESQTIHSQPKYKCMVDTPESLQMICLSDIELRSYSNLKTRLSEKFSCTVGSIYFKYQQDRKKCLLEDDRDLMDLFSRELIKSQKDWENFIISI